MKTKYASPERSVPKELEEDYKLIQNLDYVRELLNAFPFLMVVLNKNRQIVFCNNSGLAETGNISIMQLLGKRPGETLQCVHSCVEEYGCGTAESCRVCGALSSIIRAQRQNEQIIEECRITVNDLNNARVSLDFRVSSTPVTWGGKTFILFSAVDISHEKRRQVLEHIFFHDILNKTGSLSGFVDLIKSADNLEAIRSYASTAELITREINEELISQRTLLEAENNELIIHPEPVNSIDLLNRLISQLSMHPVCKEKKLLLEKNAASVTFQTDPLILSRILTNMLKNALEAITTRGEVHITCIQSDGHILFRVKNQGSIDESLQMQIFQRSFSTKGRGRGIGTYSMRLLGEKYLGGKVYFDSDEQNGTAFYFMLPVNNQK